MYEIIRLLKSLLAVCGNELCKGIVAFRIVNCPALLSLEMYGEWVFGSFFSAVNPLLKSFHSDL